MKKTTTHNNTLQRVLIVAGGTGGHIFPGLAVANVLQKENIDVQWLGSEIGLEQQLVSPHYPLTVIAAHRIRGKRLLNKLGAPIHLLRSTWQAWQVIRKLKPDVVLAMGGFVSAPGGLAARLTKTPLVIHEQNAIAGYTNRIIGRFANIVLAAFPNAFTKSYRPKIIGNPVRAEITALPGPYERSQHSDKHFNLLILGGSQGAKAINTQVIAMLREFPSAELRIWHQTGKANYAEITKIYEQLPVHAEVSAFIDDMVAAYEWADLIICRSGALTVAELAAAGVASILIPFPYAVDDHQWHNACYLADQEAAILIREADLTYEELSQIVQRMMQDRTQVLKMAENARRLAKPKATTAVINALHEAANRNA